MTVFVSSLPYETTTTDLITHFSFIGPVKNGFVVKDKVSSACFTAHRFFT
jgi:nucleolar protein 4